MKHLLKILLSLLVLSATGCGSINYEMQSVQMLGTNQVPVSVKVRAVSGIWYSSIVSNIYAGWPTEKKGMLFGVRGAASDPNTQAIQAIYDGNGKLIGYFANGIASGAKP